MKKSERHLPAQHDILQENEFMNIVFSSLTDPFYVIDADNYKVKMANPAAGTGMLSEESTCYALIHKRNESCENTESPCVIKKIKETGKPVTLEHIHYDGKGNQSIYEVHGSPVFDDRGNITHVLEYNIDVTGRKKTETELRKFKILSDNANDVHFLVGWDGRFKYVNKAACIVSGYSEEELLSMSVPDIDMLHDLAAFREVLTLIQKEKIPPIESINRRKDGSLFPVEITLTGHQINGEPYMFAALMDISER